MITIRCPNCTRCLGTTNGSLTADIYCKGCKAKAHVSIKVAHAADYLSNNKEEKK